MGNSGNGGETCGDTTGESTAGGDTTIGENPADAFNRASSPTDYLTAIANFAGFFERQHAHHTASAAYSAYWHGIALVAGALDVLFAIFSMLTVLQKDSPKTPFITLESNTLTYFIRLPRFVLIPLDKELFGVPSSP